MSDSEQRPARRLNQTREASLCVLCGFLIASEIASSSHQGATLSPGRHLEISGDIVSRHGLGGDVIGIYLVGRGQGCY